MGLRNRRARRSGGSGSSSSSSSPEGDNVGATSVSSSSGAERPSPASGSALDDASDEATTTPLLLTEIDEGDDADVAAAGPGGDGPSAWGASPTGDPAAPVASSLRAIPLRQRSKWLRPDVAPFAAAYAALIYLDSLPPRSTATPGSSSSSALSPSPSSWLGRLEDNRGLVIAAGLSAALGLHLMLVLASQWSVRVAAWVSYARCCDDDDDDDYKGRKHRKGARRPSRPALFEGMTHVWITADDQSGIVPVLRSGAAALVAEFQHRTYRWSENWPDDDVKLWLDCADAAPYATNVTTLPFPLPIGSSVLRKRNATGTNQFRPVFYPTNLSLDFYVRSWRGHGSLSSVQMANRVYGENVTQLTLPTFSSLLGEQLIAPFFLFQMLCVLLWSLDEYWIYALYTLVALLVFESTVAYNRLKGLERLRRAGQSGADRVWVWRGDRVAAATTSVPDAKARWQWVMIRSRELVPGDVVSLTAGATVPADVLLLQGSGVVDEALLTGESIPQLKDELEAAPTLAPSTAAPAPTMKLDLQDASHRESVLFSGTSLLAVTETDGDGGTSFSGRPPAPDRGLVGLVLRTGFETSQGSLLRTLATSKRNNGAAHTMDAFAFVFGLVVCAVAAASWVWHEARNDERRNPFRLLLHLIILVTSVVPPELPMELSLAVTNSVAALMHKHAVYCTEHFRIPLAGKVDLCAFDKTGTITSDEMRLMGVRLLEKGSCFDAAVEDQSLTLPCQSAGSSPTTVVIPWPTLRVMAGCHALAAAVGLDGGTNRRNAQAQTRRVVGDPLEAAVLLHSGFELVGNRTTKPQHDILTPKEAKPLSILHRFSFSSKLKRMTTLVEEQGGGNTLWALCKGAPETVKVLLKQSSLPDDYDAVSLHHMSRGRRVLAMAYRKLGSVRELAKYKDAGRDVVERDLEFAGFLVLDCPLKSDSKSVISELRKSRHRVVMITGDALLTAAEVARQVGIIRKSVEGKRVFAIMPKEKPTSQTNDDVLRGFECVPVLPTVRNGQSLSLSSEVLSELVSMEQGGEAAFCMTGDVLATIATAALQVKSRSGGLQLDEKHQLLHPAALSVLSTIVPLVSVFARHAPHQKEAVLAAFNQAGRTTCMCGDGTNDVGALKRASVGISIVSAPEVEEKQRHASDKLKRARMGSSKTNRRKLEESMRELREAQDQLDYVELGDASVAAPFTSRQVSIKCCKDVIQQGRCTLVSMLSIYKILGVNCLVNAMVLSKLFLHGAKQGERQLTGLGIVVAALFFFVTRAEPLPTLSPIRPPSSVLCPEALLSMVGQFLVHCAAIWLATDAALAFTDPYDPSLVPDGPFNPNPLNTCTFLMTCLASINTFAVNYRGRPFTADLRRNRLLYRTLQGCYLILFVCATEAFPPLNDLLQLSPWPTSPPVAASPSDGTDRAASGDAIVQAGWPVASLPTLISLLMVVDTAAVFALERLWRRLFDGSDRKQS